MIEIYERLPGKVETCETTDCQASAVRAYQTTTGERNRTVVRCLIHRTALLDALWTNFQKRDLPKNGIVLSATVGEHRSKGRQRVITLSRVGEVLNVAP